MIICDKISFRLIKQPIHQIDGIIFLLIDNLSVHLRHLNIGMAKQLGGSVEVSTKCQHHCCKCMPRCVKQNIGSKQMKG